MFANDGPPSQPVVIVHRPTVIAFFPPLTTADLQKDPYTNEALGDFQFYAEELRKPLRDEGIDFHEIYALSFRVQRRAKTAIFRSGKIKIGYYFVDSTKEPRIEYGVMTSVDVLHIARE